MNSTPRGKVQRVRNTDAKAFPTYFYHSFPRIPNQDNFALGLKILDSILEKGLLLTAELQKLSGCGQLDADSFIQQRACFTAISPRKLPGHAKIFGAFSLEFEEHVIRNLGALPTVYFTTKLAEGSFFNGAGEVLIRHLLEARSDLFRLWQLHDHGSGEEKQLAKAVLQKIHPSKITIQEIFFTLQALLNLCYPTDDIKRTIPSHYYNQREWKIIPNFSLNRDWHYPPLTSGERKDLLELNPQFFGADIKGKPRVDHCLCFRDLGNKSVVDSARRIIVPDELLMDAEKLVADRGRQIKVVPISAASIRT